MRVCSSLCISAWGLSSSSAVVSWLMAMVPASVLTTTATSVIASVRMFSPVCDVVCAWCRLSVCCIALVSGVPRSLGWAFSQVVDSILITHMRLFLSAYEFYVKRTRIGIAGV